MDPQLFRTSISQRIVWRDVEGDLVLFDDDAGCYHALDAVGSRIWRKLAAGLDASEIAHAFASTYDAPAETIADQIAAFMERAVELNLLVKAPEEPST